MWLVVVKDSHLQKKKEPKSPRMFKPDSTAAGSVGFRLSKGP